MWLVVYKQSYYPSVYECETKKEAELLYDKIKAEQFTDPSDDSWVNEDGKLYMTEIVYEHGDNSEDVDWYIGARC